MAAEHPLTRVARKLASSITDGAATAGPALLGQHGGPDAQRVRRSEMVQYVRDNWADPQWRQELFARVVPAIPNPFPKAPDGSDAEIPARNGVASAEALLKEAFPDGWPPRPRTGVGGDGMGFQPDAVFLGGAG
jgi:hypothetical protein